MATTRRGDFTHKSYLYKVYENGFNHKHRDYITPEIYMDWEKQGIGLYSGGAFIEAVIGVVSGNYQVKIDALGDAQIPMDASPTLSTDSTRPANIISSDLTFTHSYFEDSGDTTHIQSYYLQVFDYKIVFDISSNTVEAFYDEVSLASDTLTSSYDYIRMYEDEGTFYIDNSSDGTTWSNFANRVIDLGNDQLIGQLIVSTNITSTGADGASVTFDEINWLRHDNGFKTILNNVIDDLQFTENINEPATSTTIKLKQDPVFTPNYIKNGAFIDIYANYWGYLAFSQSDTILDHDGLAITDENNQPIIGVFSPDLTPEEDSWIRFSGYIDSIEDDYDAKEVTLTLVSHGEELANVLATSGQQQSVVFLNQLTQNANESSDNRRQTFTIERTQKLNGITVRLSSGSGGVASIEIGSGTTTIAETRLIRWSGALSAGDYTMEFIEDVILQPGIYWFQVIGPNWYYQNTGNPYTGGSRQQFSGGSWSNIANTDAYFQLHTNVYDTEINYTSENNIDIITDLVAGDVGLEVDGALKRVGSQITLGQIDDINYDISLLLKLNTVKEAIDRVYEQTTLGWWWSIDTGTSEFTLQAPATEPEHVFYVGKDILELKIKRAITNLKNDVYFIGGEINEAQATLTIRTLDTDSIAQYRRGLSILSDGRVLRYDTAQAFSDFEIAQNSVELITTEIEIQAKTYDIETIRVGDLVRIVNLGGTSITLQVASLNYTPLSVTLSLANVPNNLLKNLSSTQRSLDNLLTLEADNAI